MEEALAVLGLPFLLITIVVAIVVNVLYLLNLQNTLKAVTDKNRKMPPVNVWLLLIPIFSNIYMFFVVNWIGESLRAEFDDRGIQCSEKKPGYGVGLAMAICSIASILISFAGIASFVLFIIYWVKTHNWKIELQNNSGTNILDDQFVLD